MDVLEVAVHVDAQRRVARERAEAARHVGELLAGRQADDLAQQPVARALGPWHPAGQLAVRTEARAQRHVGLAGDDWRDEQSNVGRRELPVGVDADDDVGTVGERRLHSRHERAARPEIARVTHHARAMTLGDRRRSIRGSVVDDDRLELGDAGDVARNRVQQGADRRGFVQRRQVHDELHGPVY